ncbi:MAG: hypothetical protein JNL02_03275 [Saprospiraceae bacterium]|nr:hypothetical protein [Saprospiraceae bacterium]MCC7504688.1 hypothetical protein [Saprospiraceae bacterium]
MSKKLFFLPVLMLVLAVGALTTACDKECETKQNDYTGSYLVTEDCSASTPTSYASIVSAGAADNEVLITNFWGAFQASVRATIDCDNITIARQEPDGDKFFVEGSGTRSKDGDRVTITFSYTVTDETNPASIGTDNCSNTTFVRQ